MATHIPYKSRLPDILQSYQNNLQKIDALERKLEEKVAEKRHRAVNILDELPTYRRSTLRLYITHQFEEETIQEKVQTPEPPMALPGQPHPQPPVPEVQKDVKKNKWNLNIEGKLLTGHLDHESATIMEKACKELAQKDERRYATQSEMVVDTADMTARERAATRFMHDREGEEPLAPIKFAHFFDRMSVSFQTFQKTVDPATKASAAVNQTEMKTGKGQRSKKRTSMTPKKAAPPTPVKKKDDWATGPVTSLFWNRQRANSTNPNAPMQSAADTNAFHAIYSENMEADDKENTIVATIRLHRRDQEQRYKPSSTLCTMLLPNLMPKKQKPSLQLKSPPEDNDVYVPPCLSMDDAIVAVYQYVKKKNLQDETDRSVINNDTILEQLFGCKQMKMGDVRQLLSSRGLLVPNVVGTPGDSPVILTYVMKKETASNMQSSETSSIDVSDDSMEPPSKKRRSPTPPPSMAQEEISANTLSTDIGIDVPHVYHGRCRDILRRIKIREYEYTSCRTKALRTVEQTKVPEDVVKERLENIVKGKALTADHHPCLAALAKAAPPGSEARISAHLDARKYLLVDRLEFHSERANACWDIIEKCWGRI